MKWSTASQDSSERKEKEEEEEERRRGCHLLRRNPNPSGFPFSVRHILQFNPSWRSRSGNDLEHPQDESPHIQLNINSKHGVREKNLLPLENWFHNSVKAASTGLSAAASVGHIKIRIKPQQSAEKKDEHDGECVRA